MQEWEIDSTTGGDYEEDYEVSSAQVKLSKTWIFHIIATLIIQPLVYFPQNYWSKAGQIGDWLLDATRNGRK